MALALLMVIGCGDGGADDDDDFAIDATASIDAPSSSVDAAALVDAAATPDAEVAPDAAPPDAANACGKFGKPCGDPSDCGGGFECVFSVGGSFCAKARPGCGGFAGATCDDPAAPLCHYIVSASAGICVDEFERDCICQESPASIEGCP